ncbi:unnamed protein product [Caenorhabditis sp. 36 PRJEB53466]|nr:unnamed protein product [Caenorhabditis sp. 36 PRJEB53466]
MGNAPDKCSSMKVLPSPSANRNTSSPLKTSADDDSLPGQPSPKRVSEWIEKDAGGVRPSLGFKSFHAENAAEFWRNGVPAWAAEPVTPTKFETAHFPTIESRSPTSRFWASNRFQKRPVSSSSKNRVKSAPIPNNTPTSDSSFSFFAVTDSTMKRQKKKEKKKARQMNKEQLLKKQKLQRAEVLKNYEMRAAEHKRLLAEYAAAVAKPTATKKEAGVPSQPEKGDSSASSSNPSSSSAGLGSSAEKESNASSSKTQKEFMPKEIENDVIAKEVESENTEDVAETVVQQEDDFVAEEDVTVYEDAYSEDENVEDEVGDVGIVDDRNAEVEVIVEVCSCGDNYEEHIEEEFVEVRETLKIEDQNVMIEDEDVEPEEEMLTAEEPDEEFEVLICGQRRKVKPFIPRAHQNSSSGDECETITVETFSSNSVFDIPEHEPIVVPFRDAIPAPPPSRPQRVTMNSQPPPPPSRFMAMPLQMQRAPPVIFGQPIVSSYGQLQPRYSPMYGPSPFPPMQMIRMPPNPMPMPGMPIAMLMNGAPMFLPQQPGLPIPPQMQMQQAPHMLVPQQHPTPIITSMMALPQPPPQPQPVHQNCNGPRQIPPIPLPPPPPSQIQPQQHQPPLQPMAPPQSVRYPGQRPLQRPRRKLLAIKPPPPAPPLQLQEPAALPAPTQPEHKNDQKEESPVEIEDKEKEAVAEPVEEDVPIVVEVKSDVEVIIERNLTRQTSSVDLNSNLIASVVAVVLDESEDKELPCEAAIGSAPDQPHSSHQEEDSQLQTANRVLGFSKHCEGTDFDIWAGWTNGLPPRPEQSVLEPVFEKMLEEDQSPSHQGTIIEPLVLSDQTKPNLVKICKKMEPYFMNSRGYWMGASVDSEILCGMFEQALGGSIPESVWPILEKVCLLRPGYFHIFDVLIGNSLELSYNFKCNPGDEKEGGPDPLHTLYQSLPPAEGVEKFFTRFENNILPELNPFISNHLVTIRAFVTIIEIVKEDDLSVSDLYYLATLVFGSRQFYHRFLAKFTQFHVVESGGKRWIRQQPEPNGERNKTPSMLGQMRASHENRARTVTDFISILRQHIDDVLQLMPDSVVNDIEFFKTVKLVCGWNGKHEEQIWEIITKDRSKFQEFYDSFRPFFRIEIRMGSMYLKKLAYSDDDDATDYQTMEVDVGSQTTPLIGLIKSGEHKESKSVSYAIPEPLFTANIPTVNPTQSSCSTQTDHLDLSQVWNLERELIRLLARDNSTFSTFIQSDNAREMYQFLVDLFKHADMRYFAYVMEKAVTEMRQQSWQETVDLRRAAEEARQQLEVAREQHEKEFGNMRSRMETISRFETYEVQVESNARIDALKERIKQMTLEKDMVVKEEAREEKEACYREMREMAEKHLHEKRLLEDEVSRLKHELSRVLTEEDVNRELQNIEEERAEVAERYEREMNKARAVCKNTSLLLRDSQLEIKSLREQNQILIASQECNVTASNAMPFTPDPTPIPDDPEDIPPVSPPPFQYNPSASHLLQSAEKMLSELNADQLRVDAHAFLERYNQTNANRKERKTAEKQLKEFKATLESIECSLKENIELLRLNIVDGLIPIPEVPLPFSEKVTRKVYEEEQSFLPQGSSRQHGEEEEDCCLICYETVPEDPTNITCETCSHQYHYDCISRWLRINSVCPACYRALKDPNEYPSLG